MILLSKMWKHVPNLLEVKELYYSVTPESDRNETLLERFPNQYRAFCFILLNLSIDPMH